MVNKISDILKKFGKKKLILILTIIVVVTFVVLLLTDDNGFSIASGTGEGREFASEYEELNGKLTSDGKEYPEVNISSNNVTKYSNVEEVVSLFDDDGDAVVYFGYSTCLYCRTAVQVLYDVIKDTELDKIYYLNIEEQQAEKYGRLYELLGEELVEEDEEGNKSITAPLVIFVASGAVVSYQKGTLSSQVSPYDSLDQSQIDGLGEIYTYGIRDVLESIENKKIAGDLQ